MRFHCEPKFWELQIGRLVISYWYAHPKNIFALTAHTNSSSTSHSTTALPGQLG